MSVLMCKVQRFRARVYAGKRNHIQHGGTIICVVNEIVEFNTPITNGDDNVHNCIETDSSIFVKFDNYIPIVKVPLFMCFIGQDCIT